MPVRIPAVNRFAPPRLRVHNSTNPMGGLNELTEFSSDLSTHRASLEAGLIGSASGNPGFLGINFLFGMIQNSALYGLMLNFSSERISRIKDYMKLLKSTNELAAGAK